MPPNQLHNISRLFISLIWVINGLFCKVLNLVPRHQQIVSEILGEPLARELTIGIGVAEILMALWILSGRYPKISAVVQIAVVLGMNTIEIWLVPDLLLWGNMNLIFAIVFAYFVYHSEFILRKKAMVWT